MRAVGEEHVEWMKIVVHFASTSLPRMTRTREDGQSLHARPRIAPRHLVLDANLAGEARQSFLIRLALVVFILKVPQDFSDATRK